VGVGHGGGWVGGWVGGREGGRGGGRDEKIWKAQHDLVQRSGPPVAPATYR
jgi:hypothetical protein